MNWQKLTAPTENRTEVLSRSASYAQVFRAVVDYAREGAGLVRPLADRLRGRSLGETARSVYAFIRSNVTYANDPDGIEQIALPNRTLREGRGDCDDMAILAASLLLAMGHKPRLYVVRTGRNTEWNHIFCTLGDRPHPRDSRVLGYVIDPVPPLTRFDQLCDHIQDITEIMELHALRGLDGTPELFDGIAGIAPLTDITRQALEREREILRRSAAAANPAEKRSWGKEWRKNRCLMALNGLPEQQLLLGLMGAVDTVDDRGRILLSADADLDAVSDYLDGQTASLLAGMGAPKVLQKIKALIKKPAPKTAAPKNTPKKPLKQTVLKVANALTKVNPLTVAARNGAYAVLKLNLFRLGSKFAKAYLTEAEAKAQGLDMEEWKKLKAAWPKVEQLFYGLGADPANLKKHVLEGAAKGAKRGIKGTDDEALSLLAGLLGVEESVLHGAGISDISLLAGTGLGNPALVQAAAVMAPMVASAVVEAIRKKSRSRKKGLEGLGDGGATLTVTILTAASGVLASVAKIIEGISFKKMTSKTGEPLDDEHRDYKNPKAAEGGGLLQNVMNVANQVKNAVKDVLPMVKPAQGQDAQEAMDAGAPESQDTDSDKDKPKDGPDWMLIGLGVAAVAGGWYFLGGKKGKKR